MLRNEFDAAGYTPRGHGQNGGNEGEAKSARLEDLTPPLRHLGMNETIKIGWKRDSNPIILNSEVGPKPRARSSIERSSSLEHHAQDSAVRWV